MKKKIKYCWFRQSNNQYQATAQKLTHTQISVLLGRSDLSVL